MDLGKEHTIYKVSFSDGPCRRTRDYAIQAFLGKKWVTLKKGTETNFSATAEVEVDGLKAQKVRVVINKATGTPIITEIRVFGE